MRKTIRYFLTDPTGNRTILVETPVPAAEQSAVAAQLMALEPTAEQAGFLTDSKEGDVALRMAGGEFCANATMSAAVVCGMRAGMTSGVVTVEASGAPHPVAVEIAAGTDGIWQGIVQMPRPKEVESIRFSDGQTRPVVSFDGITHVILEGETPQKSAETLAKQRCAELHADALGLMFWDRAAEKLTPLVYVPGADTLFWETSCGSGTAAVGAYLASIEGKPVTVSLRQSGGTLTVTAAPDGTLRLCGAVRCEERKTAEWSI